MGALCPAWLGDMHQGWKLSLEGTYVLWCGGPALSGPYAMVVSPVFGYRLEFLRFCVNGVMG